MRLTHLVLATSLGLTLGCDSKKEDIAPQKTKSLSELSQDVKDERSPEELEKARTDNHAHLIRRYETYLKDFKQEIIIKSQVSLKLPLQ